MGRVHVLRANGRPRCRPRRLAGDKGYSYGRIRRGLRRRRIKAVIPTRKDQRRLPGFDEATYRRRNVVERCVGWVKDRRRLATRFEKLAENFLARVKLATVIKSECEEDRSMKPKSTLSVGKPEKIVWRSS